MDTVSRLIRLARPEGSVDVRCLLAGHFLLDNPASRPGKAPFHLLLEGRCAVEYRGRTIQLCAGDVVLFPHGGAHRVLVEHGAEPVEAVEKPGVAFPTLQSHGAGAEIDLFCGHYSLAPGAGELLFRTLPEPLHVSFGTDAHDPVRILSTLMRQEAQANGPGTAAIVSSLCDALLAMVLRSSPGRRVSDDVLWTSVDEEAVLDVIDAVLREPERDWSIAEFADRAAMSRATFIRHFSHATGMAVGEFVTGLRMAIAADMLADGDRSVSVVAAAVGYRSESAFGRAFRLATANTPARFRANARLATRPSGLGSDERGTDVADSP
jgi:AraC family transcriptional activator of mtrCDE